MNKSFHYYCIRVLAEKAGFAEEEAQTIAYASQYTDDSTEHGKIKIANIPAGFDYPRWNAGKNTFDPVCTAHSAKSWLAKLWKWAKFYLKADVQRKILMPFHFLPPDAFSENNAGQFNFVTQENSLLANLLMDRALQSVSQSTETTHTFSLIRLGIALHSYADTWSHAGFSGRHNSVENDIKKIKIKYKGRYKSVDPLKTAVSYAAPDVGHAEAGAFPDTTDLHWSAKYAHKKSGLEKANPQKFCDAAEVIYEKLSAVSPKKSMDWDLLSPKINQCLEKNGSWENTFQDIKFEYSRFTWRAASLSGDSIDWDDFDDENDFHKLSFQYTGKDERWLLFHKAAFEQRKFLDEKIPQSWTNI